jgi:hypothetical protein
VASPGVIAVKMDVTYVPVMIKSCVSIGIVTKAAALLSAWLILVARTTVSGVWEIIVQLMKVAQLLGGHKDRL